MKKSPLAIVGMSCLFPRADGLEAYWANLKNAVDAITEVPDSHWKITDYFDPDPQKPDMTYAKRGGFLSPWQFDPLEYGMAPKDIEVTDTSQLLAMVAARRALEDAGYSDSSGYDPLRTSVILGVTGTLELVIPLGARLSHPLWRRAMHDAGIDHDSAEDAVQRISEGLVGWQENAFPGLLGNVVAGRIANRFNLGGTNCVVDAACASSLAALELASLELETGRADMVISGGVDTFNDIFMYMCFSKTPALSPSGDARPFADNADGTIIGEGLGLLVLKRLSDAERDGDRIHAVIRGIGSSSDGKGKAIYEPSAEGQSRALRNAYRNSGISPATVSLVEAHGTGTKVGDAVEVSALTEVYREASAQGTWCALGSVKSNIGHTKAAAGVAGIIKAALALEHKVLPPTLKVTTPNSNVAPGATPFYLNTERRPWLSRAEHPRRAAVSSFGFGGSNFHSILEEYTAEKTAPDWSGEIQILAFSAATREALTSALANFPVDLPWQQFRTKAAASRATFDSAANCRLLAVVEQSTGIAAPLTSARAMLTSQPDSTFWQTPDGVTFGSSPCEGDLALLFPGQGSQYTGMLNELCCLFPEFLNTLEHANTVYAAHTGNPVPLSDLIYPPAVFSPTDKAANERVLRATDVAQPAIGAVSLGAWRVLETFAVNAAAAAGHSYGELSALCVGGAFEEQAFFRLSCLRGALMASIDGDSGSMLAVQAPLQQIAEALKETGLDLVLANKNAPEQGVLSGSSSEIERAEQYFTENHHPCQRLPVAAAFHSPLVAEQREPFAEALRQVDLKSTALPVYANVTGSQYPADPQQLSATLADQLASPVEFVAEIENLYGAGIRAFLEVGPGGRLTGLVKAILGERPHTVTALDSHNRQGIAGLANALCWLAAQGRAVDLTPWDSNFSAPPERDKPRFSIAICGANHRDPQPPRPPRQPQFLPEKAAPVMTNPSATECKTKEPITTKPAPVDHRDNAAVQQHLSALQNLQEQTAELHARFLEIQQTALQTMQALLTGQPTPQPPELSTVPVTTSIAKTTAPTVTTSEVSTTPKVRTTPESITTPEVRTAPQVDITPEATTTPEPITKQEQPTADQATAIEQTLLEIIAEKTGYPVEMLNPEMGLDADLGIDSIKRVEILSAMQERFPQAPVIKPEHQGTLKTLAQIVAHLSQGEAVTAPPISTPTVSDVGSNSDSVATALLEIVAEKTGYPVEMLSPEMGLDADLGIDSIKRVEILSAMQERFPQAPVIKPEHQGTLKTLAQIIEFLSGSATAPEPSSESVSYESAKPSDVPNTPAPHAAATEEPPLRSIPVITPISEDRSSLPLSNGARVWVAAQREDERVQAILSALQKSGAAAEFHRREHWQNIPERLTGLIIVAPSQGTDDHFLRDALLLTKACAPALRDTALSDTALSNSRSGAGFFITVLSIDGAFGFAAGNSDFNPEQGALAGLAKTAAIEWPEVACKTLDIDRSLTPAEAAQTLLEEAVLTGPVEIGISAQQRITLALQTDNQSPDDTAPLAKGDPVIISGGARGVTAEAALALAETLQPTLILLGRSPLPDEENPTLQPLTGEAEIKRALLNTAATELSPKDLQNAYDKLLAAREIRQNLARLRATGVTVEYHPVDVRDTAAVAALCTDLRSRHGAIKGLIHGAGVLADQAIEDKTAAQFDAVYGTKVTGLQALLSALQQDELKVLALFSSSSARFGRAGQVDYAMANEALNKIAQREAQRRTDCKVVAFNWGPWQGGMVTPALAKIFSAEGISLIPLRVGAHELVRELQRPGDAVEVIFLGADSLDLNAAPADSNAPLASPEQPCNALDISLDLAGCPILADHIIGGKAVLPLALSAEWLAQGALQQNPGLIFHGFDQLQVLKGIRIGADESLPLQIVAEPAVRYSDGYRVHTELRSSQGVRHIQATVLLTEKLLNEKLLTEKLLTEKLLTENLPTAAAAAPLPVLEDYQPPEEGLYGGVLFHGPRLQAITAVSGCSDQGIAADAKTGATPATWLAEPLRQQWLSDPLALDAVFQLLIVWSSARKGMPSLPAQLGSYRQYRASFPTDGVRLSARITATGEASAQADIDILDHRGDLVARLQDYQCTLDSSLVGAFRNNQL